MGLQLKPFTYLDLDEVKEHLKIKPENKDFDNRLIRMMNTACQMVEKYIDGPVLTREFTEEKDGNHSNVLVPAYYPVTELVELRIDYDRGFGDNTLIDPKNTILRGQPNMSQLSGDVSIKIDGGDILLRDATDTTLLGRLFTGSSAASIKIKYKAGRGATPADLPEDLTYATLLLCEYLFTMRDNRELNVKSKTNNNQGYTRETGWPVEVTDILDGYKDYTFGSATTPQKNNFPV